MNSFQLFNVHREPPETISVSHLKSIVGLPIKQNVIPPMTGALGMSALRPMRSGQKIWNWFTFTSIAWYAARAVLTWNVSVGLPDQVRPSSSKHSPAACVLRYLMPVMTGATFPGVNSDILIEDTPMGLLVSSIGCGREAEQHSGTVSCVSLPSFKSSALTPESYKAISHQEADTALFCSCQH